MRELQEEEKEHEQPEGASSPGEDNANGKAYNKSSSFFDNISCESKERLEAGGGKPRTSYAEQRRLDTETFGSISVNDRRCVLSHLLLASSSGADLSSGVY